MALRAINRTSSFRRRRSMRSTSTGLETQPNWEATMPQYLSPGVYVEEVPGTPSIVGVGTSTAGFVGVVDTTLTNPGGGAFAMPFVPGSTTNRYTIAPQNE